MSFEGFEQRDFAVNATAIHARYTLQTETARPALLPLHASCEDYRASATIDLEHDRASDTTGEQVRCPMLVLWGDRGVVARLFDPLADWTAKCSASVVGKALPAGHFIPEEAPELLMRELGPFLAA